MTINAANIFNPKNSSRKLMLGGLIYDTPIHYLYYHVYARDNKQRKDILNIHDVDALLTVGYQLQEFTTDIVGVKSKLYTLFTYLVMFDDDAKDCIMNDEELLEHLPYYGISNDEHLTRLYNETLRLFIKNIVLK